ncbi:MAG: HlyD family efflux transporter periplasmic adaptor subunit [Flavobacteriales bacterium]|nr:HlyD family efflux transporter periplasmic adaptor subunit [Flavobacteriales bacterium]
MKNKFTYILMLLSVIITSCNNSELPVEEDLTPKTPVTVVNVNKGEVNDELSFLGTTFYLKRNVVAASIPAFITQVNIKLGDKVKKGDVLYTLQSKESKALTNSTALDTSLNDFGIVQVKASASGIISTLDKQQSGDYVLEGTQLCTIAESNDLVFQVNVPFEYTTYTKTGDKCTIILPNEAYYKGTFTKALTAMNVTAQTQTILAKCNENLFLPENMIVKVIVNTSSNDSTQVLPKSCVLSDEMLKDFWVMQLINDSTAIKVPVSIGNKNSEKIEIIAPQFKPNDKIISIGNYGLADTALVSIIKP